MDVFEFLAAYREAIANKPPSLHFLPQQQDYAYLDDQAFNEMANDFVEFPY